MSELDLDRQLQGQIDQLPKQLQPSRDLWAGIDHAIEQQQQSHQRGAWPKLSVVAAGFMVIGLSLWLGLNVNPDTQIHGSGEQLLYVADMTESFEQQKQALLVKYKDKQAYADNWQLQLNEMNAAADVVKVALQSDPANAQLIKMLQQIYQQQLDLIEAVNKSPWQQI